MKRVQRNIPDSRGHIANGLPEKKFCAVDLDCRLALENRQRLSSSKEAQAITEADELVRASRRRLELWGLNADQIQELATSADESVQITTYSPLSGVVTKRNVAEGQYIKEGDVLLELADLSTVWVQADIFESDIPLVRSGQKVKITAQLSRAAPSKAQSIFFSRLSIRKTGHSAHGFRYPIPRCARALECSCKWLSKRVSQRKPSLCHVRRAERSPRTVRLGPILLRTPDELLSLCRFPGRPALPYSQAPVHGRRRSRIRSHHRRHQLARAAEATRSVKWS